MIKRIKVVKEHEASFPYSMIVRAGDTVNVGEEDEDIPGWFWCTDEGGVSAWIPGSFLQREDGGAKMLVDYNSMEHTATLGEVLEFIKEAGGWIWCTNSSGKRGWVPSDKVEEI
jgi:uncharacterized protein YgiM (DUF1202 family)